MDEIIRTAGYIVAQSKTPEMPCDEVVYVASSEIDHDARMDSNQEVGSFVTRQGCLDVIYWLKEGLTYRETAAMIGRTFCREIASIRVIRNDMVSLVAISLLFGATTIPMFLGTEVHFPVILQTWDGTGLYFMGECMKPVMQMPLYSIMDLVSHIIEWETHGIIANSITGSNHFSLILIFGVIGIVKASKRERKNPEEIIKTIFSNASIAPKSINRIAEESELQWNTAEKYIKLIELIQSLPLKIIRTEGGPTYVSRLPAEELTFDQKIAIYKLVYSPKLTESEQILISLLSKPEGEILKETPEIKRLVKIDRIKKEGNKYFLTRDGEIIAKGLQRMFSEEIR